jgi:hypothetical protein
VPAGLPQKGNDGNFPPLRGPPPHVQSVEPFGFFRRPVETARSAAAGDERWRCRNANVDTAQPTDWYRDASKDFVLIEFVFANGLVKSSLKDARAAGYCAGSDSPLATVSAASMRGERWLSVVDVCNNKPREAKLSGAAV